MSVYWLKFCMGKINMNNFYIISYGDNNESPCDYDFMIKCYKCYIKKNENFNLNKNVIESKKVYEIFRAKYEKRPNCENDLVNVNWKEVYGNVLNKNPNANLRVTNFKILNNALTLNLKYSNFR
jgi:hypothetical protein